MSLMARFWWRIPCDLRTLLRDGNAEPLRWRVARWHLRRAGRLLAPSHPNTLRAQTSFRCTAWFSTASEKVCVEKSGPGIDDPIPCGLTQEDAHGLLLQLCAAVWKHDEEGRGR